MDYERVSDSEWENMVLKSDNANFSCSPAWAKIIEKTYGEYRTATRLYHVNGKSILVPMMEKNTHGFKYFESMPYGYGGFFSESEVTTDEFTRIVDDIIGARHAFYMPLQPFENIFPGKAAVDDEWKVKDEWNYMHILDIEGQDYEHIWKNYRKRTRGSIRKAIKSGVEIIEGSSLDDFKDFFKIWSQVSSQKWGYDQPLHPFELFHNLYEYGSPYVKLTLATKDNQTIAGLISFFYSKTVYYYFSAFKDEYRSFNPTSLLYNDIIEQACQGDYNYINLGHSLKMEGVRRYKEHLGAKEIETERYLAWSKGAKTLNTINNIGQSVKNRFIL